MTPAFRVGLIAEAYPSPEGGTPWDFIGETSILYARRNRLYHGNHERAANRMGGVSACLKEGRQGKLRQQRGDSFTAPA